MGSVGYKLVDEIMIDHHGHVILEVGSDRGEGSTWYLAEHAKRTATQLVTVDTDAEIAQRVRNKAIQLNLPVTVRNEDVLHVLAHWSFGLIAFAYLDSYDYPYDNMDREILREAELRYRMRGLELTKDASHQHHLELVKRLKTLVTSDVLVVFDDTWYDYGWHGKGATAVPYLKDIGWVIDRCHWDVDEPWYSYTSVRRVVQ